MKSRAIRFPISRYLINRSCVIGTVFALAGSASAATLEYFDGHGDFGIGGDDTELELHYHFEDGFNEMGPLDVEYEPNEVHVRVADAARITTTAPIPHLGVGTGVDVWVLPQSNTAGLPFFGIGTEELSDPPFSNLSLELTGVTGPGEFGLSQSDGLGGTTVRFQTFGGAGPTTWSLPIGGHDHGAWAFTQEGVYNLTFYASATHNTGGLVEDTETFTFVVGSSTPIPEPSSLVAMLSGLGIFLLRRRR